MVSRMRRRCRTESRRDRRIYFAGKADDLTELTSTRTADTWVEQTFKCPRESAGQRP
jgi:hypothetical protein